jgi:hypothetical protein
MLNNMADESYRSYDNMLTGKMQEMDNSYGRLIPFRELCKSVKTKRVMGALKPTKSSISKARKPAIAEIAGEDSVAAVIKACREHGFDAIVPVVVLTGTEYGSPTFINKNVQVLEDKTQAVISDTVILEDLDFWRALNGRFIQLLIDRYGFYSPCPGCHLYLHAMRIPLALKLGVKNVITGERELHDGRLKVNQLPVSLDFHMRLMAHWGLELFMPLRNLSERDEIAKLTGGLCKKEDQFKCLFSGNYRNKDGSVIVNPDAVGAFYADFGFPVAISMVEKLLKNPKTNADKLVKDYLR